MLSYRGFFISVFFFAAHAASAATFKDAVYALGSGKSGVTVAQDLVTVLNLMSEKLEYDESARGFFAFMNDALEDFDFARIYNSEWLKPQANGFRGIALAGKNSGNAYRVSIAGEQNDYAKLGNTRAEYRMRVNQIAGNTTYTTQIEFDAALKKFNAQSLMRFFEALLKTLDAGNIRTLNAPASHFFPEMSDASRKIIDQAAQDFPQAMAILSKFIQLRNLAEIKEAEGKPYTEFGMRGRLRMDALATEYPKFQKFMKDLHNLFVLQLYLSNAKGQNLMSFILNTQTEEFYIGFKTADGRLLPVGKGGVPAFADAITLSKLTDYKFFTALNFFVNVYGLKISTGNIGAYLRYKASAEKTTFLSKITKIPEGKISGALFGILPTWMIDLSIPSDLQTLMNEFSQTAFKANNGEGTKAEISWRQKAGAATLHALASTEFLENRFIRIGMKIWVRKFRPNESVQEDIRRFIGSFSRAILNDLSTM